MTVRASPNFSPKRTQCSKYARDISFPRLCVSLFRRRRRQIRKLVDELHFRETRHVLVHVGSIKVKEPERKSFHWPIGALKLTLIVLLSDNVNTV